MHAHKLKVTIQEDHRVEVRLPDDFPEGPAEVIVLTNRTAGVQLNPEEREAPDVLPRFRIRAFVNGLQPGINPDKMNQLLDQLEAENVARKLQG